MSATTPRPGISEREVLTDLWPAPAQRDLPSVRHQELRNFILGECRAVSAPARPEAWRRWRRPTVLVSGLVTVSALVLGLTTVIGGTPAYAVTKNANGTINIKIREWADSGKLQSDLRSMGANIVVDYVPPGKACRQPRIADPAPREQYRHTLLTFVETVDASEGFVTRLDPSVIRAGQTALIEYAEFEPGSVVGAAFNGWIANGSVSPCVLIDSPQPW
jgi:hypothetical protein